MSLRIHLYLYIAVFLVRTKATTHCRIEDQSKCVYTVICELHAGSASNPNCDSEPYVTFVVTNSVVDTLTAGFFGSTNFDSRVRVVKAINNAWNNLETSTFRYYTKCIHMDLSNNKISNIKNEAFRNLISLESLNLSRNAIVTLNPKSLMFSDTRIPLNLTVIDLSNNLLHNLSGEVFKNLRGLSKLYLQNNTIASIADDCFYELKNLTHLYLQHNRLISLNMSLFNLISLTELDVSYNLLTRIIGFQINSLLYLQNVNMSNNAIEFIESNCFDKAVDLRILDLKNNKIETLGSNMFANSKNLMYLDLYNNSIKVLEKNIFKYNNLNYLNLEKNYISGEITEDTFRGVKNVKNLNLSNQNITVLSDAFSGMDNLLYLNLSRNNIYRVHYFSFCKFPSLIVLDMSYNKLSNLDFLRNCSMNLTELYLNNNNLTVLPKNVFDNQSMIIKLDISMNNIAVIEQYSLPLKKLQYLNVTGNRFAGVLKSGVISPAKFLRYLDLSNYKFSTIDKNALIDLPLLARLNFSHNDITYIASENFKATGNLYSLDLSYNKISHLELNNSELSNLKAVYLNNNNIMNISRLLTNVSKILYLDVSHNNISDLSNVVFEKLPDLKVFHLANNRIKTFNNPYTNILKTLIDLDLSSNQLTEINLTYFKDLVSLDISNNSFTYINSTFFTNLDYLQSLDISKNKIAALPPGTFQSLKILKLLNLSSNQLFKLRYGSLKGLHRTEVIDLSRNNLLELDVDILHECTELRRLLIDYNHIDSLDVERLISIALKLKTLSLGGNPMSCKEIIRNMKNINRSSIRQVEVTSIDKIYHEDNVYGIKCGDTDFTTTTETVKTERSEGNYSSSLLIWCSVLSIIVIVSILFYVYKYFRVNKSNDDSRVRLSGTSLELDGSNFQNDLLS